LLDQKRYAETIARLQSSTDADPDFAPGWYALALAARRGGNCAVAIPAYRRYADLRPTEAEPYFGLGLCLKDSGDRPGAAAALKTFIAREQRPSQQKWIESAKSLIATLETPAALPAAPPSSPSGSSGQGAAAYAEAQRLRDAGQIQAALGKFAEATTLEPDLMTARAAWGELLIKVHRDADAVGVFRAAVDRNPQYPLAWYELAFTLRETGQLAEAVAAYRRYIALRPTDPDPHYGLARALAGLGKADDALTSYQTYVAMETRPTEIRWVADARSEIAALERSRGRAAPSARPRDAPPAQPR
jgi:predicted Zn-dependent protease